MAAVKIEGKHFLWFSIPALYLTSIRWGMAQSGLFELILVFIIGVVITVLLVWIKQTYLTNKKITLLLVGFLI